MSWYNLNMVEILTEDSSLRSEEEPSEKTDFQERLSFWESIVSTSDLEDYYKDDVISIIRKQAEEYDPKEPHYFYYHLKMALRDYFEREKRATLSINDKGKRLGTLEKELGENLDSFFKGTMDRNITKVNFTPEKPTEDSHEEDFPRAA